MPRQGSAPSRRRTRLSLQPSTPRRGVTSHKPAVSGVSAHSIVESAAHSASVREISFVTRPRRDNRARRPGSTPPRSARDFFSLSPAQNFWACRAQPRSDMRWDPIGRIGSAVLPCGAPSWAAEARRSARSSAQLNEFVRTVLEYYRRTLEAHTESSHQSLASALWSLRTE